MRAASLIAFLVLASPALAAEEEKPFYPMKIGTIWTYKLGGQEDKYIFTAVKEEKIGEQPCVVFEAKFKDEMIASEHVAVLKDGIHRLKFGKEVIEPSICFLKPTTKKGDSWTQEFKVGEVSASAKFTIDIEDVEVPAAKYKDAVVVRTETTEKAKKDAKETTTKTTVWFVKEVGMVKQIIDLGDDKITLELEKIEMPKGGATK